MSTIHPRAGTGGCDFDHAKGLRIRGVCRPIPWEESIYVLDPIGCWAFLMRGNHSPQSLFSATFVIRPGANAGSDEERFLGLAFPTNIALNLGHIVYSEEMRAVGRETHRIRPSTPIRWQVRVTPPSTPHRVNYAKCHGHLFARRYLHCPG